MSDIYDKFMQLIRRINGVFWALCGRHSVFDFTHLFSLNRNRLVQIKILYTASSQHNNHLIFITRNVGVILLLISRFAVYKFVKWIALAVRIMRKTNSGRRIYVVTGIEKFRFYRNLLNSANMKISFEEK